MLNKEFYPTPAGLINKMLSGVEFKEINSVLEPSAGKGDIVEAVIDKLKHAQERYYRNVGWDIDTIEIDENLQHILRGKNFRIVHDDFLTYNTYKRYDLIVMNPPFSTGDKHLIKALDMQKNGGKIICLLNAETLRNLCTNSRKDLVNRLREYNADIEYIENAFMDAERKTYVEVALIKIDIPQNDNDSIILDELRQEEQFREEETYNNYNIIDADFVKGIISQYNFEVKAGLKLIAEYKALKPLMLDKIQGDYKNPILKLELYHDKYIKGSLENAYIQQLRMKYWEALFANNNFMGMFTTNLRSDYMSRVSELKDYDFSYYNIYTIKIQLNKEMIKGVEDTILNLFDEFSHKYHWFNETSKNIHYYNGWKTNKAWKINKKVIIPLNGYYDLQYSWGGGFKPADYKVVNKLSDIEKVFNYLDGGLTENIDIAVALKVAEKHVITKKIQLKYFTVTFYKKGTCHIEFTNLDLLHKFNVYGSQRKEWLPPSYGKKRYKNMTPGEKSIIDDFEGEASYNKVMNNTDYFIVESSQLQLLAN